MLRLACKPGANFMSIEIVRGLLRDFGAGIGLPELALDEQGYCCLQIGEQIKVSLQYEADEQDLVLFARLCPIDVAMREEAFEMMLTGNLFWAQTKGATLAVEPADNLAFLLARQKSLSLDLPAFNRLLEDFVETGEAWLRRLRPFAAEAAEATEPAGSEMSGAAQDYIQV